MDINELDINDLARMAGYRVTNADDIETGVRCEGFEGPCESNNATRYMQQTMYADEDSNFVTLCPECRKANDAHLEEMKYGNIIEDGWS